MDSDAILTAVNAVESITNPPHTPERSSYRARKTVEQIIHLIFLLCGIVAVAFVLFISIYLIISGLPAILKVGPIKFLFGQKWAAGTEDFGILSFILTSIYGTAGAVVIGVPLGILSAVHKGGIADALVRFFTFLGVSLPNFWVGLMLLYFFGVKLKILPVVSTGQGFNKLILPVITLAFVMAAKYTRQVRTAFLEELNQDYVMGARCRGVSEKTILWRHVLPNSILPLVTMLGLSLGSLLGGTAVVEVIFTYPGLGSLAVSAITSMDYTMIQAYVLWIALMYMVINLIVDISYSFLDPRMREAR